jgi:type II secretory pathway component HofQ
MILRRASEIVIPKVDFDETELRQAIDDIAAASRQVDPRKKGLNILLGPGVDPSTRVTLQLQNVPVANVLKYVAEFARLDSRTDGNAIVLLKRRKVAK